MLISINRERLFKALDATVKLAKANKLLLPNIVVMQVIPGQNYVTWHANDGMTFASIQTPGQFQGEVSPMLLGIQGSLIKDIVENCDKKIEVSLDVDPGSGRIKVLQGSFETDLSCIGLTSLFAPSFGEEIWNFLVHAPYLADAFEKVKFACGPKECADKRLCAIHAFSKENEVIFEATNGKVLSHTTLELVEPPETEFTVAIPPAFLEYSAGVLATGEVEVSASNSMVMISAGEGLYQIMSRIMPVNRIASEKLMMTSDTAVSFEIDSETLAHELSKITSLIQNKSYLVVNCKLSKDKIFRLSCGSDLNTAHSVITQGIIELSRDIEFNISAQLFCDSLATMCGALHFTVDPDTNKCVIRQFFANPTDGSKIILETNIRMIGLSY